MMRGFGYNLGYGMMGGGWLWGLLTFLFFALLVAGAVLLVVWAVRASRHGAGHFAGPISGSEDEATAIARRRYASGEITKEQYDEIVKALKG